MDMEYFGIRPGGPPKNYIFPVPEMDSFAKLQSRSDSDAPFRAAGEVRQTTVLDAFVADPGHNPTISLKNALDRLAGFASTLETVDLAICELMDACEDNALTGPFIAANEMKKLIIISAIESYRVYCISILAEVYFYHPHLTTARLNKYVDVNRVPTPWDSAIIEGVDQCYRGAILAVSKQAEKDVGVGFCPTKLSAARLTRLFETRHTLIHNNGKKTSKFFELAASGRERSNLGPIRLGTAPAVLIYIARTMIATDLEFLSRHKLTRARIDLSDPNSGKSDGLRKIEVSAFALPGRRRPPP